MNKCHVPITWVNDTSPAINETHLNQYDNELDTLDDRIITLDTDKLDKHRFTDSNEIDFDTSGNNVTAFIKDHSIGDSKMLTGYLTDCQTARTQAQTAAGNAGTESLKSEGFAIGEQNGVPVASDSPYYHNNAKYYKEQAQAIASQTLSGLTDVSIANPQDGDALTYSALTQDWSNAPIKIPVNPVNTTNMNIWIET